MKIKLINKSTILPNCWKSCGVDKDAWDELQNGKEIEVKQISDGIEFLVDTIDVPKTKTKKEAK